MTTQTWFIDGKCLGTFPIGLERTKEVLHAPRSYAFGCPICGEVWARRAILPKTPWFFWSMCCFKCSASNNNQLQEPGSVMLPFNDGYLESLPIPVLHYETKLRLFPGEYPL